MLSRDLLVFQRPLLNFARSTNERMILVGVCAALAIVQSAWLDKGASLFVALAAVIGALGAELWFNWRRGRLCLYDGSAVVTALTLTLFLPNTINPLFAAAGAMFAVAVVKQGFGGLGANWFNPALGGWLFIRFSWPQAFNAALQSSPLAFISSWIRENAGAPFASPVTILNKNGFGTQNGDAITSFLNKTLFSLFNTEIPAAYLDFFIDPGAGLIADRGLFALLFGSVIMIGAMAGRAALSAVYVGVLLVITRLAGALPFGGPPGAGDMIYGLFSGGTLAAALILVVEPASGPKSSFGKGVYVCLAALFTFLFRYGKAEACGALFAAAVVNIFAPVFRLAEERWYYERNAVRSLW